MTEEQLRAMAELYFYAERALPHIIDNTVFDDLTRAVVKVKKLIKDED